jgi:hypothetical protein
MKKMAKAEEKKETSSQIKDEILELSAKLQKDMSIDKKTGNGTEAENLYTKHLPDGLSTEVVKQVKDYDGAFIAAGTHAFGQLAIQAMKKNSDLPKATIELSMGNRDSMAVTVERSKDSVNQFSADKATVTKFGVTTVTFDARAGASKAGQLKHVRAQIAEMAAAQLKA